ncbi:MULTISPECIES: helix-turn-helix domain-containing protein [Nocardia]|nr:MULTISPECIES: helix-turn-helix transcriptional regulator [Nocardia]
MAVEDNGVDPRLAAARRLATELRRVKDAADLSYSALQSRIPYSKSSLQRYVQGNLLPPRDAVQAIAQACDADPAPLLRLWDEAVEHSDSTAAPPGDVPEGEPVDRAAPGAGTATHRSRRWWIVAALTVPVVVAGALLASADRSAPGKSSGLRDPMSVMAFTDILYTTDTAHSGVFEATRSWHGDGPYDGGMHGTVRLRRPHALCATAHAWFDGREQTLGTACEPNVEVPVSVSFTQVERAYFRVCLAEGGVGTPQYCTGWR